jgi:methionyl-tRNA synthetase
MEKNTFYVTTPIFYPNAELHLGHAYAVTVCDILARYHRLKGDDTYFLTGADENTSKVIKAAHELGKEPRKHLDDIVDTFKSLFTELESSHDQFIRTSDEQVHWPGAIKLWNKLVEKGDIEKRSYKGLYCPSCEAFYTEKDLLDGKCPLHFIELEIIEEENYFFLLSRYTHQIREKIENGELNVIPETRKNEILSVLKEGLQDVSFSRPRSKVPWGVPVPGDEEQVMYVWCDALSNYISALGYGTVDESAYEKFWPADIHVVGKDILRFHAAIWPGMLLSAGLPLPKNILATGLIQSQGKKMSKSLGNTISPKELIAEYGAEALRLYLAKEISLFDDGELNHESFKAAYNADLANGIGNLTSRIMKMAETNLLEAVVITEQSKTLSDVYNQALKEFNVKKAIEIVFESVKAIDTKIQETQPFKLVKTEPQKGKEIISELVVSLNSVALHLQPFLPTTATKIQELIKKNKVPSEPLFLRKE